MSGAKRARRSAALAAALPLAGLCVACVTKLGSESLVPPHPVAAARHLDRTLRVAPVTREKTRAAGSDLGAQFVIDSEPFQEALVASFEDSGIFGGVEPAGPADYELRAHIVSQQTQLSGFATTTSTVVVSYRLRESAGDQEVWHDTIVSQASVEDRGVEGLSGSSRKSLERAAQRNISEMLEELSEQIR